MRSPPADTPNSRAHAVRHAVLIGALYFAAALAAIFLSRVPGAVNTLWYASGIGAASLQSRPAREWPGVLLAIALAEASVNLIAGHSPGFAVLGFAANLSEILVGAILLRRACDVDRAFHDAAMLLRVLVLGAVLPSTLGALLGAAAMGLTDPDTFAHHWQTWFQGSWIGNASVLPLALLLAQRGPAGLLEFLRRPLLLPALLLVLLAATWGPAVMPLAYVYVTSALLLLTALGRFPAAAVGTLATSAILGTPIAAGQLAGGTGTEVLAHTLLYLPLSLVLMPPLMLGAMLERLQDDVTAVRARELHFRELYQKAPVMMHSVDSQRRIVEVNDAWLARLGYARDEVLGRDSADFLSPESRARAEREVVPRFLRDGYINDIEYRFLARDGEPIDVLLSAIWERDAQGRHRRTLSVLKDVTEARTLTERLAYLAHHDALTGLPNRVLFRDMIQQACSAAAARQELCAVLFMDLDHFKRINDSLGHASGDELLRTIALRLREGLPKTCQASRLGGDEFVILATALDGRAAAGQLAAQILASVARPCVIDGTDIEFSFSIGIALYPDNGMDPDTLMKHADVAMYRAKRDGRNRFDFFSRDIDRIATARLQLETDIRHGLQHGEFLLHFQPIVDARTRATQGVEALARWSRPGAGLQGPAAFIPVAEESGTIVPLGATLLRQACAQLAAWRDTPHAGLRMAVNVSMVQLAAPEFAATVTEALRDFSIAGPQLWIEMTESTLMRNPEITQEVLRRIKTLGVNISIDDFGTGYSSLSYLRRFPVDALKIDRSFVRDLEHDPGDRELVNAILAISRSLHLHVVAEGVENAHQAQILSDMGCPALQGFHFGQPASADDIVHTMTRSPAVRVLAARRDHTV